MQPLGKLQVVQHSHHRGDRRRKERARNWKSFDKIMKDNSSNLMKEIDMQVQEVQRVPNKMDARRPTPRHITIKIPKVKDKETLKSTRKEVSYQKIARSVGGSGENG